MSVKNRFWLRRRVGRFQFDGAVETYKMHKETKAATTFIFEQIFATSIFCGHTND